MADDGFTPDWDALTEEATELLSAYIRVDTVNPPGNETRACDFYGEIHNPAMRSLHSWKLRHGHQMPPLPTLPTRKSRKATIRWELRSSSG